MTTDTRRKRRTDPGEPDDCPVFTLHRAFVDKAQRDRLATECRRAGIGCLECKQVVIDSLETVLGPFRERRPRFATNPKLVWDILASGADRAQTAARQTMAEVREGLGF